MAKRKRITDAEVKAYLARASNWKRSTGMVANGIRVIERLIRENQGLRKPLKVQPSQLREVKTWKRCWHKWVSVCDVFGVIRWWCQLCGGLKHEQHDGKRPLYEYPTGKR